MNMPHSAGGGLYHSSRWSQHQPVPPPTPQNTYAGAQRDTQHSFPSQFDIALQQREAQFRDLHHQQQLQKPPQQQPPNAATLRDVQVSS